MLLRVMRDDLFIPFGSVLLSLLFLAALAPLGARLAKRLLVSMLGVMLDVDYSGIDPLRKDLDQRLPGFFIGLTDIDCDYDTVDAILL